MRPLGGLLFAGATLAEFEDFPQSRGVLGRGVVGRAALGRTALLGNLELRLGLDSAETPHGLRLQRWSRLLGELAQRRERFYSKSFEVDPVGTASTLLGWRELLLDAGWNGERIAGGGERLEAFAELERELDGEIGLGTPDRLRRVEAELAAAAGCVWPELELAEAREVWPGRWQRIFRILEARGTRVREVQPRFAGARRTGDLGRLQRSLSGEATEPGLTGDGSLVLLTGDTSWELAHAVSAALRHWQGQSCVVVRGGDLRSLEAAMSACGMPSLGLESESVWRPALQVLPLAVELLYTPRDPYRVLELVTLPLGPFAGWVGSKLAESLSAAPGVGGRPWQEAKRTIAEKLAEDGVQRLDEVADWLEGRGYDAHRGAPCAALREVAERVAGWLQRRLIRARIEENAGARDAVHDVVALTAAWAMAQSFREALDQEGRAELDLVAVRQLLEEVALASVSLSLATEEAGRCDHVDTPAGLRCARDTVVWWHCVNGTQRGAPLTPWRKAEREALATAGVVLQDTTRLLGVEAESWRAVIRAAEQRLVLVAPSTAQGERLDPHPIWDEIVARMGAEPADVARITLSAQELLTGESALARSVVEVAAVRLTPLELPKLRSAWTLTRGLITASAKYSATSLEYLLGCPLNWVFRYRAGLGSGWAIALPSGPLLNGRLGHRLIEELHHSGVLPEPATVAASANAILDRLLYEEAATLLCAGMTFELSQLRVQLVEAAVALSEVLARSGLTLVGVESESSVQWAGRTLEGRIDLLLVDSSGTEVVLDAKWGRKSHVEKLAHGSALQLAFYAAIRRIGKQAATDPVAAYFSLSRGEVLTTELGPFRDVQPLVGPKQSAIWKKIESALPELEGCLELGMIPTGANGLLSVHASTTADGTANAASPSVREALAEPACGYCGHSSLCGRAWEQFA